MRRSSIADYRKQLALCIALLGCVGLMAQSLPTRYTNGKDRVFFTLSHPIIIDMPSGYSTQWYANEYNLQLLMESRFGESIFSIGYGLGYTSSNFHHNLRIDSDPATGKEFYQFLPDTTSFRRNKLNTKIVEVPIEFRFRPRLGNGYSLRLYAGFKAGYIFEAYARYSDDKIKLDDYRLDDINPWVYGVYLKLGYRLFSIYGYYGLQPFFTGGDVNGQALEGARQLSFGISISG